MKDYHRQKGKLAQHISIKCTQLNVSEKKLKEEKVERKKLIQDQNGLHTGVVFSLVIRVVCCVL